MNIGFIGFGEAAYNIALGLYWEGVRGIRATDAVLDHPIRGQQIRSRAEDAHVELVSSSPELAAWADVLFAAVPSAFTLDVCAEIKDSLAPGKIYADVSASTAKVKETVWTAIRDTGALFVDAAMLGPLPTFKHKVPILASGNGAEAFRNAMTPFGMKIDLAGEKPGDASAIKLIRSIYMKGVAALMVEMLRTADAYGVTEQVVSSVAATMDSSPFVPTLDRLVTGTAIHCTRRASELKGSVELVEEAGLDPEIVLAAKHIHEAFEPYGFADRNAISKLNDWTEVIETLRRPPEEAR